MKFRFSSAQLAWGLVAMALAPVAQAAALSLDGTTWAATGATGLIAGGSTVTTSPAGNARFGYVSTAGGVSGVSPLLLKTDGKGNEAANNGSTVLSSVFSAQANDTLSLTFNYISTDGRGYEDYAWARLVTAGTNTTAAWLFTARSANSARGNVVPGDVLKRQQDNSLPDELDAVLNNGASIGFNVSSTVWDPLGVSSGFCWDTANTCGPSGWIHSDYTFTGAGNFVLEFGVVNWGDEVFDSALAFDFSGLGQARFPDAATTPASTVPEPASSALALLGLGLMGGLARRKRELTPVSSRCGPC